MRRNLRSDKKMTKRKQEIVLEPPLNIDMVGLRDVLDGMSEDSKTQDIPFQMSNMHPLEIGANHIFDMSVLHQDDFPELKVDTNPILQNDDCSLLDSLVIGEENMDTSNKSPLTIDASPIAMESQTSPIAVPSSINEFDSPVITSTVVISSTETTVTSPRGLITPTSGPTPIMTPINSMPNSPCGSLYSGYSSGWGPPSPPSREPHRKKRSTTRTRARAQFFDTSVVSVDNSMVTPKSSPRNSVVISPADTGNSAPIATTDDNMNGHTDGNGAIPRHKRPSHIRAEHKRRNKIQGAFDDLKKLIPYLDDVYQNGGKESKATILIKNVAREHQKQLPTEGAEVENMTESQPTANIQQMYRDYVGSRSLTNWKFWIFNMLMTPLWESYVCSVDSTGSRELFITSVLSWFDKTCSLVSLRPIVFKALRNLSKNTSIMTQPEKLQEEALAEVYQTNLFLDEKETPL